MQILNRFPVAKLFALALLLGVLSIVFGTLIKNCFPTVINLPYTVTLFLFIATWGMYQIDRQPLFPLGLLPTPRNLALFIGGCVIGIVALGGMMFVRSLYTHEKFHLATSWDIPFLVEQLYIILPTVAAQEFMFRGYFYTKTIALTNVKKANLIFAILFTLVHVLDENALHNPYMFISLAVSIPVGHLFFATGLLRTRTLYFPIGLHLGNNWATNYLSNSANNGHALLYSTHQKVISTIPQFIIMLLIFNAFYLIVTWLIYISAGKLKKQLPAQ
jgi:membrane protease YdiL (CAAX protease family)